MGRAGTEPGSKDADDETVKSALRGALAFPITPFRPDDDLDLDAIRANAELLAASDVGAIVAPSGTGEFFALTPDEIVAMVAATVEGVGGRKPVIAATGFGPRLAGDLARAAEAAGAAAVMIMPPYYGNPDPDGLLAYYAAVADATSVGVIPYARDAALFSPELVERLCDRVPSVVAFKDGRGDVRLFLQIREHVTDRFGTERLVWLAGAGDDLVGPYFAAGAEGFTSSLACFWPEAAVELYRLAAAHDVRGLAAYHERVVRPIYELRQRRPGYEVAVMKAAMEILGHVAGPARPPLANLTDRDWDDLRAILAPMPIPRADDRQTGRTPESSAR